MGTAHQRSWQTWCRAWPLLAAAGCAAGPEQDTIWPPADFALTVEEGPLADAAVRTAWRFHAAADGVVVFGGASGMVVDAVTGTELPVFSRLAVYELVPTCTRALARRVHRAGVLDLEEEQGQREGEATVGTVLRWRAFGTEKEVSSWGRVHGAMAEVLAIVGAHLPDGEAFATPGVAERGILPVLRGVPTPREDAAGALAAYRALLVERPRAARLLRDAFALACHLGRRDEAIELLRAWRAATEDAPPADDAGEVLTPEILARMLPASGS